MTMNHSQNEIRNRNKIVTELLNAQHKGTLSGIHGRLGDLATIDEKYDVAISTACSFLEHIVVETVTEGEKCLEFLKMNKIGYAKIICLDKMGQLKINPNFPCPNGTLRLYDLI